MSVRLHDLELLDAVRAFTLSHPAPEIERFKPAMRDWGNDWIDVKAEHLPAAERLDQVVQRADCAPMLVPFARHYRNLRWEQSYTRAQRLVPEAMLDGYGFTEVVGKLGPFVSERIRAGISIIGPGIEYPRHRHQAEEIYAVLAGGADFRVGDESATRRVSGDVVYIAPGQPHGFSTTDDIMVIFYLWQAGDLRQTSTFA
ncbi:MAG: dimethylsulfonioproprionate lyase family protein [Gammaproteobacteria bacterium]|nr:dimethylsulfonioproprionate lyase family protein [Gammaproteobacteria bacterium]